MLGLQDIKFAFRLDIQEANSKKVQVREIDRIRGLNFRRIKNLLKFASYLNHGWYSTRLQHLSVL